MAGKTIRTARQAVRQTQAKRVRRQFPFLYRVDRQLWAQALVLAGRKGLSGNSFLNRLVAYAVAREFVPEYIQNPQLPMATPLRETEPPLPTPVYDGEPQTQKRITGKVEPAPRVESTES